MGIKRLKTLSELEGEYGTVFVADVLEQYPELHNKFGESLKYVNSNGFYNLQSSMITEEPLIPIGSKVMIPTRKSLGVPIETSTSFKRLDKNQYFFYYIGYNMQREYHALSNSETGAITDWYAANEILEAYYKFESVENSPLFKLFTSYKNEEQVFK